MTPRLPVALKSFRTVLALTASVAAATSGSARAQAAPSATPAAPPPTCRVTLDSLSSKLRQNYAGFLLEVRDARRVSHDSMLVQVARTADGLPLDRCFQALNAYVGWFDDPHLFVLQGTAVDSATAARRRAGLRRLELDESAIRMELDRRRSTLDPIEGIWFDGPTRYAVVRDPAGADGRFIAVLLASDTVAWPVGAVRGELVRRPDGSYATTLRTRGFGEQQLTGVIHKRTMLRLSPGIWGKAWPLAAADTSLIDTVDVHRPRVSVRERSVVFSVPSHDPAQMRRLDSLVAAHTADIRARPLLIVDLRGNEGGSSGMSRALAPFVASTDRRATPFDSGAAVMLSSPAQIAYARRFTGTDTSAFVRSLVRRLEAHPGQLVPLEETPTPPRAQSAAEGAWRVAVLVDRGTVSAAEVLVLLALRSTRAVVIGEPTAGALDYQSTQVVGLGTGDRRWALGYPTITAHADLPRRGMRGRGIAPDVMLDWKSVADPIAEVERRLVP